MTPDPAVLVAAFLAGLLGSGHCFGMCGGIAGSLGVMGRAGGRSGVAAAAGFNGGRVLTYTMLGAVAAVVLGGAGTALAVPGWSRGLRLATALLIAAVGLQFAFGWRGPALIERVGSRLWRRVSPLAMRVGRWPGPLGHLALGMTWGLLPCGLVYTVLLTAATTGSAGQGALTMAAFGLGTLPSMLGLTLAAPTLSQLLSDRSFRRFAGLGMLLLAGWMIVTLVAAGGHHHHH